jgi:hypothetical protein
MAGLLAASCNGPAAQLLFAETFVDPLSDSGALADWMRGLRHGGCNTKSCAP